MGGGHAQPREVGDAFGCGARGNGRHEAAAAEVELGQHPERRFALGHQIEARDAERGHAVGNQLADVSRPDEQHLDVDVAHRRGQRARSALIREAGLAQEPGGGCLESSLVRHCEPQRCAHDLSSRGWPVRSSIMR